jgi:hypothetical protein
MLQSRTAVLAEFFEKNDESLHWHTLDQVEYDTASEQEQCGK